jgi:hypothetical protein
MSNTIATTKSKWLTLGLLAGACLLAPAAKAQSVVPTFGGSYSITGYFEPALSGSYTWCFDFVKTGSVLFANSGTWSVPSYAFGWKGTWYQDGDEIIFHGVADGTYLFSWKGRLDSTTAISGRQVEFYINGNTDTAGTFTGTKAASCPAVDLEAVRSNGSDPVK